MSPLARSLLALACAALLRATCGQSFPPKCKTAKAGVTDGIKISLPVIQISGPETDYQIPDNCGMQGMVLQGETATLCDWNATPDVVISENFREVHVSRNDYDPSEPDATLQVVQYCRLDSLALAK